MVERYLGVDGRLHSLKTEADLLRDDKTGLPWAWKLPSLPDIALVAKVPESAPWKIDEHPLRQAWFKYEAAREHKIFQKQRPQDVTMDEAVDMARAALSDLDYSTSEISGFLEKYFPKVVDNSSAL